MSELSTFTSSLLEWLDVPAGEVKLEGDTYAINPFRIAKYPVTNGQFAAFIDDAGYKEGQWWVGLEHYAGAPRASDWREDDSPKLEVCWYEAVAFTRWLAHNTGLAVRLPTEWEWQWAAVGDTGWDYPYGSTFDATLCNTKESGIGRTNVTAHYADVNSPFGVVDMCGNVWEWCLNEGAHPYSVALEGGENRALRGGSWNNPAQSARAKARANRSPRTRTFNIGFRMIYE
jgi:formylglycine-generating enzyme required for sulfatase activity